MNYIAHIRNYTMIKVFFIVENCGTNISIDKHKNQKFFDLG